MSQLKTAAPRHAASRSPRRRWLRRIAIAVAAVVVLVVLAAWAFVKFGPTAAPLTLPAGPASAPSGPLDGSWVVGGGSVAGFRVQETALGLSNDAVGRTTAVTGSVVVSGGRVTSATLRVDLAAITVSGKPQRQFAASLRTGRYPEATFILDGPVALPAGFAAGHAITLTVTGQLEMNGVTRQATASISARRDGRILQVAGSIPVTFSAWQINGPGGLGFLGSLADHGTAEFLLILRQA
jgi:polyisoprenoid-binding protein YceI